MFRIDRCTVHIVSYAQFIMEMRFICQLLPAFASFGGVHQNSQYEDSYFVLYGIILPFNIYELIGIQANYKQTTRKKSTSYDTRCTIYSKQTEKIQTATSWFLVYA